MKKIILGLMIISSTSSFAMTEFEGSKNYEARHENDDGTVTVVQPKIRIDGLNLFISNRSDLNGLCKLYGLGQYVANSERSILYGTKGTTTRINADARVKHFDSLSLDRIVDTFLCYKNDLKNPR